MNITGKMLKIPKMAKRPHAAHITKASPTEPDLCNTPPGLIKIPEPATKMNYL